MATLTTTNIPSGRDIVQTRLKKVGLAVLSFMTIVLAVNLRESLDAKTSGDKSDAAWALGM